MVFYNRRGYKWQRGFDGKWRRNGGEGYTCVESDTMDTWDSDNVPDGERSIGWVEDSAGGGLSVFAALTAPDERQESHLCLFFRLYGVCFQRMDIIFKADERVPLEEAFATLSVEQSVEGDGEFLVTVGVLFDLDTYTYDPGDTYGRMMLGFKFDMAAFAVVCEESDTVDLVVQGDKVSLRSGIEGYAGVQRQLRENAKFFFQYERVGNNQQDAFGFPAAKVRARKETSFASPDIIRSLKRRVLL